MSNRRPPLPPSLPRVSGDVPDWSALDPETFDREEALMREKIRQRSTDDVLYCSRLRRNV
jgi:hypothetical protein